MKLEEKETICTDEIVQHAIELSKKKRAENKKILKSANMTLNDNGTIVGNFEIKEPEEVKNDNLKKLHLSEEMELNEEFSSSMPGWLKNRLMYDSIKSAYNYSNKYKAFEKRGYNFKDQTRLRSNVSILQCLNNCGVDLSHANFISAMPTSGKDKILKFPNICIFHIYNEGDGSWYNEHLDFVYIRKLYDDGSADTSYNTNATSQVTLRKEGWYDTQLKFLSVKKLLQYTTDFCYIDGNDQNNFVFNLRDDRGKRNKEVNQVFNYNRKEIGPDKMKNINSNSNDSGYDKSGYIRDPKKYAKKLAARDRDNAAKIMEDIYNELMDIKKSFSEIIANYDINKSDVNSDNFNTFAHLVSRYSGDYMQKFSRLVERYNEYVKDIDLALSPTTSKEDSDRTLNIIFGNEEMFGEIKDYRKQIKNFKDNIESQIKDTLTGDLF